MPIVKTEKAEVSVLWRKFPSVVDDEVRWCLEKQICFEGASLSSCVVLANLPEFDVDFFLEHKKLPLSATG